MSISLIKKFKTFKSIRLVIQGLGKMKLEGIYDKAIFIAPKVYALKNKEEE